MCALEIYNIGQSKGGWMGANRLRVPNVACPRGFPYFPRLGLHIQHSTMLVRASDATCGKRERGWGLLLSSGGRGEEGEREGLTFNPIHAGVFLVLLFKIHVAPRKNFIRWNFFEKS